MKNEVFFGSGRPISRREVARKIVVAAAIGVVPGGAAAAASITDAVNLGPKPKGLSAPDWNEVHAKFSDLLRNYGDRLSSHEKHILVNVLTTNQHMLASIRSFEVQNGDPSACTLQVYQPIESARNIGRSSSS